MKANDRIVCIDDSGFRNTSFEGIKLIKVNEYTCTGACDCCSSSCGHIFLAEDPSERTYAGWRFAPLVEDEESEAILKDITILQLQDENNKLKELVKTKELEESGRLD